MAREQSLETMQAQYADFRRRAEPGLTKEDILVGILSKAEAWEAGHLDATARAEALGELLIDLCCLAEKGSLDLAHHARQAFKRMQAEYERDQ
jgi:NTP pyrophosphatase (non-canonical NTP hydrolase)